MSCQALWQIYIQAPLRSHKAAANLTDLFKVLAAPIPQLSTLKTYHKGMQLFTCVLKKECKYRHFYITQLSIHSYRLLITKRAHSQFLADLIPPYWQTLEFPLSVAHRGQIPS